MPHFNFHHDSDAIAPRAYADVATDFRADSVLAPLATRNAMNCVIILLHDSLQGRSCLAHSSPGDDGKEQGIVASMMLKMIYMWGSQPADIDVFIGGGSSRSAVWATELYQAIQGYGIPAAQIFDGRVRTAGHVVIGTRVDATRALVFNPATARLDTFNSYPPDTPDVTYETKGMPVDYRNI